MSATTNTDDRGRAEAARPRARFTVGESGVATDHDTGRQDKSAARNGRASSSRGRAKRPLESASARRAIATSSCGGGAQRRGRANERAFERAEALLTLYHVPIKSA